MLVARLAIVLGLSLLAASPAAAFDCAKATTEVEKAICASPEARETDDRMAAAYGRLKASLLAAEARALRDSQRQWLKFRDETCTWRQDNERTECVIAETRKRHRILAGEPKSGPGTGPARLKPLVIARPGDAKTYTIDISTVVFADPATAGERAFNGAVAGLYADAPINETIDFESPGELTYNLGLEVTYAAPDFISALASGWRYDGGAHGNSWTAAVNVDLKNGRLASFADLFAASARQALYNLCRDQLIAQKRDKMDNSEAEAGKDLETYRNTIDEHVGDLSRWSFDDGRAEVTFDPYALGSYAEGEYTCRFDLGVLRLYANPGAILPR